MNLYLVGSSKTFIEYFKNKFNETENIITKLNYLNSKHLPYSKYFNNIITSKIKSSEIAIIDFYSLDNYSLLEIGIIIAYNIPFILVNFESEYNKYYKLLNLLKDTALVSVNGYDSAFDFLIQLKNN